MRTQLIFKALIILGATCFVPELSLAASITEVAAQVTNEMHAQVHATKRELMLFNYSHFSTPENFDPVAIASSQGQDVLKNRIKGAIGRTWSTYATLNNRITYTGGDGNTSSGIPGFYAALDPVVSANYGGKKDNWSLLELKLPVGFRYLELGDGSDQENTLFEHKLSDGTLAAMKGAGCPETHSTMLFISPQNGACAKIAATALRSLSVDAILYPFDSSLRTACPTEPQAAFVLTNPSIADRSVFNIVGKDSVNYASLHSDLSLLEGVLNLGDSSSGNDGIIGQRAYTGITPQSPDVS